jgi:ElaB/YqjD/DUF883 family membrane-anchored ribosome-binding protein
MVEQVQPSVSGAAEKMKEGAQEFRQAVATSAAEAYEQTAEALHKYRQRAAEKFNEYSDEAADLIKGRPLTSVLVAFGTGLLLGMLFFRRS